MSVHDDLRDMWNADEGGPWEFLKAAVVFIGLLVFLYLLVVTLWAAA